MVYKTEAGRHRKIPAVDGARPGERSCYKHSAGSKIVLRTVIGCGGERDKERDGAGFPSYLVCVSAASAGHRELVLRACATMSVAKKGRKAVRALTRLMRRIVKWLLRKLTAQSEIGRILRSDGHSSELVQAIAQSIARSSSSGMERVKSAVFGKAPFDVTSTCDQLMEAKAIGDEHKSRLTWCLEVRSSP